MTTTAPAHPKRVSFMWQLIQERELSEEHQIKLGAFLAQDVVPAAKIGGLIDWLLKQPKKAAKPAPADLIDVVKATPEWKAAAKKVSVGPGVYTLDGKIYVVKPNKAKTRFYAKRITLAESGPHTLEYAPGVIFLLTEDHRMTKAEAEALAVKFTHCLACNHSYKEEKTPDGMKGVIGPVCIKYFK